MSWFPLSTGKAMLVAAALAMFAWLAVSNWGFRKELLANQKELDSAKRTVDQQSGIISVQAFNFQRANEISATADRYGMKTDAATQGKEIEYRTILKNQPTCDLAVPAAIAGGLLDYTNRLRSRSMSGDTTNTDTTGAGATASGTLTYCQAVLWIDPLLAALDKANNQLLAIRQLDAERMKQ
ncbi:hypothetical protein B194_3588 [Serratia plymuthica A30]|uniref:hypothetical protein n=1 Tax=Serratia plymuthica TaxID=82996 RepID=UPI0002A44202|nr:hypothetical protein [Serratia plymuthica]EKF63522.1 hypothetical protein B194_3588 [Serratia plymuthica A30]